MGDPLSERRFKIEIYRRRSDQDEDGRRWSTVY